MIARRLVASALALVLVAALAGCNGTRIRSDWLTVERCMPPVQIQGTAAAPIYEWGSIMEEAEEEAVPGE